jgi:DNA-directed RNA polymerase specialized sigma24 family protein
VAPGDAAPLSGAGEKLEGVNLSDTIAAFYEKEMPRLVLFVMTVSSSLDGHGAADVAQTAFERALRWWPARRNPKAWL